MFAFNSETFTSGQATEDTVSTHRLLAIVYS